MAVAHLSLGTRQRIVPPFSDSAPARMLTPSESRSPTFTEYENIWVLQSFMERP